MVDGINIKNPSLPVTVEARDSVSQRSFALKDTRQTQSGSGADPIAGNDATKDISSVIGKAAERRLHALSSANVSNFLEAAEKLIDASLPSKPPGTKLRINLDDASGRFIYQGIDVKTGDVVTQYPSEEILRFVAFSREQNGVEGIVLDEEA